jgi:xanthine dehydrogenase YagT iron-sulfur-binding subunit
MGVSRRSFIVTAAGVSAAGIGLGRSVADAAQDAVVRGPEPSDVTLQINGTPHTMTLDPRVTLLDALRDHVGLTGTKKGCDQGTCGACTVMVNGRRIDSCLSLAMMHEGDEITTVEGLAHQGQLSPLQSAFIEHDGFQCGFCTPGQLVSATAMLSEGHGALDRELVQRQMSGNICRCGCYPHIVDAILTVEKTT